MTTTISAPEWDPDADPGWLDEQSVESVLQGARDRIRFGWHQGGLFGDLDARTTTADAASAYCLEGAIEAETATRGLDFRVAIRAKQQVALAVRNLGHPLEDTSAIARFNDAPYRAKDEVIAVLDRALDTLESS